MELTKPPRRAAVFLAMVPFLACSGCCTMFELFCGPDKSRWVSVSYDSPRAALDTFMEAVRREDVLVIYKSLGEGFKERTGIKGSIEAAIAWEKIKEMVPFGGAHLLGTAQVEGPERLARDRMRFVLTKSGERLQLDFVRQPYWEVVWDVDGTPTEDGEYVGSISRVARVSPTEDGNDVTMRVSSFEPMRALDSDRIQRAGVGHEWKIDGLGPAPE